jgi:hypothetical protein
MLVTQPIRTVAIDVDLPALTTKDADVATDRRVWSFETPATKTPGRELFVP